MVKSAVKVGFIVEGHGESIVVESANFQALLHEIGIEMVRPVVNARGNGNQQCVRRFEPLLENFLATCSPKPDITIVLTDLECDPCITETKKRVGTFPNLVTIVQCKALESWYMADKQAMYEWIGEEVEFPEKIEGKPKEYLQNLAKKHGKGAGTPVSLANRMIHKFDFSIARAASHPNCPSAKYFVDKLREIAT